MLSKTSREKVPVASTLLPLEIRAEYDKLATEQDRSVSYLLRKAAIHYLERLGRLPTTYLTQSKEQPEISNDR